MKEINIPIQLIKIDEGYHLLIEVQLDEQKINLVVDTGASKTIIDLAALNDDYKNLLVDTEEVSTSIGDSELKSSKVILKMLHLSEIQLSDIEIHTLDLSSVTTAYEALDLPKVHGILGSDILFKYQAIINFRNLSLSLIKR